MNIDFHQRRLNVCKKRTFFMASTSSACNADRARGRQCETRSASGFIVNAIAQLIVLIDVMHSAKKCKQASEPKRDNSGGTKSALARKIWRASNFSYFAEGGVLAIPPLPFFAGELALS